jgi:DNA invertase Pin-like site-specific DNA recombinase
MLATMLACVAEFERGLLRERVLSGLAAAKARGVKLGRPFGTRVKSDALTPTVLARVREGASYRVIARDLGLSKNTVLAIVSRHRTEDASTSTEKAEKGASKSQFTIRPPTSSLSGGL